MEVGNEMKTAATPNEQAKPRQVLINKVKALRSELTMAQRRLDKLEGMPETPAYKVTQQQQYIRKLQEEVRELEERLGASEYFTEGHALLVGVGADLPVTIEDATALADFLEDPARCAYPPRHVSLLTGPDATRDHVLLALDTLAQAAGRDSTVIVYFSGHGYRIASSSHPPEFYLMPYGYRTDNLSTTCISGKEFTDKLRSIHAKKLLVLLDCCHAGGMAQPKAPDVTLSKAPLPLHAEALLSEGSGRVILSSSRADEKSYVSEPYSQFTIALLEALAGAGAAEMDGYARVLDIALYVGRMVPNRTHDAQHPILKVSNLENNFALAYYAGGNKTPLPIPQLGEGQPQTVSTNVDAEITEGYRTLLSRYRHNLLEIEMQMAEFIDQRAVPLDLLKARERVMSKIEELEKAKERGRNADD
jgi:hypothetical protein